MIKNRIIYILVIIFTILGVSAATEISPGDDLEEPNIIIEYPEDIIIDEEYNYLDGYDVEVDTSEVFEDTSKAMSLEAVVIEAGEPYEHHDEYSKVVSKVQDLKVKIIDKTYTGTVFSVRYSLTDDYYSEINVAYPLSEGDRVYVYGVFDDGGLEGELYIQYYDKQGIIILMVVLYSALIVLIGGIKGLKALISLILTVLALFFIMIPAIYNGSDPMLMAIGVSVLVIILTFLIVGGFKRKTWAGIIGTSAGILFAGIITYVFGIWMKLSGLSEETYMLTTLPNGINFNFRGIMFSGIIIGALGSCMDVGMSIASAIAELKQEAPDMTIGKLIKSGMNIGKDIMGTMTNTLILAYIGSSLTYVLLFIGFQTPLCDILNHEMISEEILRSLAGSMGLVCTIPLTAIVSGLIIGGKGEGYGEK